MDVTPLRFALLYYNKRAEDMTIYIKIQFVYCGINITKKPPLGAFLLHILFFLPNYVV